MNNTLPLMLLSTLVVDLTPCGGGRSTTPAKRLVNMNRTGIDFIKQ
ncbi:MAG: hypothetical protein KAG28_09665 [Cocleimonas sp.]|nr:hypothetical protein [Cocleimonas sp.]